MHVEIGNVYLYYRVLAIKVLQHKRFIERKIYVTMQSLIFAYCRCVKIDIVCQYMGKYLS